MVDEEVVDDMLCCVTNCLEIDMNCPPVEGVLQSMVGKFTEVGCSLCVRKNYSLMALRSLTSC